MKKETIILYANQYAALERLTDGQLGLLFRNIYLWLNGQEVDTTSWDAALVVAFRFLTLQISIDNEKYLQSKKRREKYREERAVKKNVKPKAVSSRARVNVDGDEDGDVDVDVDGDVDGDVSLFVNKLKTIGEAEADTDTERQTQEKIQNFKKYWNDCVKQSGMRMRPIVALTPRRVEAIKRVMQMFPPEQAAKAINNAMHSPFCNGETKRRSRPADFDWLMQLENFTLALEGNL